MFRLNSLALRHGSKLLSSKRSALRGFSSVHNASDYDFSTLVEMQAISCVRNKDRPLFGTLHKKLATSAPVNPTTNPAEEFEYHWMSYGEFSDEVTRFRTVLSGLGVSKGDKIAIISNNRVEWAALLYAANGLGAALVPMYEAQSPKDWEFIVNDWYVICVISCYLVIAVTRKCSLWRMTPFSRKRCPSLAQWVSCEECTA